jgi:preprotein translocase subunit SecA
VLETKRTQCDQIAEQYASVGYPSFVDLERSILLQILDAQWKDHLHTMDGLRDGVSLRGYAQKDPKLEYQREGYALFEEMNQRIDAQGVDVLFKFALPDPTPASQAGSAPGPAGSGEAPEATPEPARGAPPKSAGSKKPGKIGRNDPCSCGSGRKYKKCCGAR